MVVPEVDPTHKALGFRWVTPSGKLLPVIGTPDQIVSGHLTLIKGHLSICYLDQGPIYIYLILIDVPA